MIRSFKDRLTEAIFNGQRPRGFPADVFTTARRKLALVHAAPSLESLKAPPGNRHHPLTHGRSGQHAIWINNRFRVCFRWTDAGPEDVEITDYH